MPSSMPCLGMLYKTHSMKRNIKFSGPVLATGVGLLGSMKSYQFTPYPVTTAATASTVPVTTSPVSLTTQEWEPTISGQPLVLSKHDWPSLPAPLKETIPAAWADTKADDYKVREDASEILVAKQEEQTISEDKQVTSNVPTLLMGLDIPTTTPTPVPPARGLSKYHS